MGIEHIPRAPFLGFAPSAQNLDFAQLPPFPLQLQVLRGATQGLLEAALQLLPSLAEL